MRSEENLNNHNYAPNPGSELTWNPSLKAGNRARDELLFLKLGMKLPLEKEKWFKNNQSSFETGGSLEWAARLLLAATSGFTLSKWNWYHAAIDGLREANIFGGFWCAIAWINPFPSTVFFQSKLISMVLKAKFFMQRPTLSNSRIWRSWSNLALAQ